MVFSACNNYSQVVCILNIRATVCLFAVNRHDVPMGEKKGACNDQEARIYSRNCLRSMVIEASFNTSRKSEAILLANE